MKKLIMLLILAALIVAGCSSNASGKDGGDSFPNKPISVILPYGPGGSTDTSARALQKVMDKYLPNNQTIVVENQPGGGGTIGLTAIHNAEPDGYTVGLTTIGPITVRPHLAEIEYTHDSFQPVLNLFDAPNMLVVRSDAPWDTFEEWLEDFKGDVDPFTYSVGGTVTGGQLAMLAINSEQGTKTEAVPYTGGGEAVAAFLGEHTDGYAGFPGNVSGDYKILFNFSSKRSEQFPDVPTLKDNGINVGKDFFNGIIAPKGIPEERLKIIHDAFKQAMEDPQVVEELKSLGFENSYLNGDDFQELITDTFNDNGKIISEVGLE